MRSLVIVVSLLPAATVFCAEPPAGAKKLIEWGWDEPDTAFIRKNIETMEQYPFDGFVFHATSSGGENFVWQMWGSRRFELSEFQHAIEDLKATRFRRFTDRFLRVNVTPGDVDWFDDATWAVVRDNFALAARIAKESGCKGFMFDVEQYNSPLFDFSRQKHKETKGFTEYRDKVRQRGREWMQTVNEAFPDITILLTFGYRIAQAPVGKERSEARYGLLADFLDGMLETCAKGTRLVDAWEYSYPYRQREQFRDAYRTIKVDSVNWTSQADKYGDHVDGGFGIWMDCHWRQVGWNLDDFAKNHFTPRQFEDTVRWALQASDEYVWIYTEQPRWWTNERLPKPYVDALARARKEEQPWVTYEGKEGPGKGKRLVFVSGDEEYRSEEACPMLAQILAQRHGYTCDVLFAIDPPTGNIDPWEQTNIPGLHLLKEADAAVFFTRFRELPDDQMQHIVDFINSGKGILGIRPVVAGFLYKRQPESPFARYSYRHAGGGFGKLVFGETWVAHHGAHGRESTRGVVAAGREDHPILRGVSEVWGPTDVYRVGPLPEDTEVLLFGQVVAGMQPGDPPVAGAKNDPMMPIAWTRRYTGESGKTSRVFFTSMGASVDFQNEGLRRLLANACYWAVGRESQIPAKADVEYVSPYEPTFYSLAPRPRPLPVRPSDHRLAAPAAR